MSERRRLRDLPALCFAFVGLIAGHLLSYLIAIPDAARRDAVLAETGHAYLHLAGDVAIVLAFASVVTVGLRAVAERGARELPSGLRLAWRLGALQAGAFVAMEVGERLVNGARLGELFADHLFGIGIVLQLVIASFGALPRCWLGPVAAGRAARSGSGPAPREHLGSPSPGSTPRGLPHSPRSSPHRHNAAWAALPVCMEERQWELHRSDSP
jgi:hypothetical protein